MRAVIEFEHDNDIPKYKKKSRKSGLKRSTHKHQNIHVQLEYFDRHRLEMYGDRHVPTSKGVTRCLAEVCQVFGRIHNKYFNFGFSYDDILPEGMSYEDYLKTLPVWHCRDFNDKFAKPSDNI